MPRKLFALAALSIFLSACRPAATPEQAPVPVPEPVLMNGAKLGEFCGGIAGIACDKELTCKYDGNYPDAGGICVES